MVTTKYLTPEELLYELELYGMMSYKQASKLKGKTILSRADLNNWAWKAMGQSLPKAIEKLDSIKFALTHTM